MKPSLRLSETDELQGQLARRRSVREEKLSWKSTLSNLKMRLAMKYCHLITILFFFIINFCTNVLAYDTNSDRFQVKVAVVDVQSTLENSVAVQSIREAVYKVSKKIQQDMADKDIELKKIETALIEKRPSISEEEFQKEVLQFDGMVNLARKDIQDRKTHLDRAHAEAMGKVHETTINIISDLAKKHNVDLVIPRAQILFAKSTLNMTMEVIDELNSKLKNVEMEYE